MADDDRSARRGGGARKGKGSGRGVRARRTVRLTREDLSSYHFFGSHVTEKTDQMRTIMKSESPTGEMSEDDALQKDFSAGNMIKPPLPLDKLAELVSLSSILPQCIRAMETNVHGFGFELDYIGPPADVDEATGKVDVKSGTNSEEAKEERKRLRSFFETIHPQQSWSRIRKKMGSDYWTIGNGYFEITRNRVGKLAFVSHVQGKSIRLTRSDQEATEITVNVIRDGKSTELPWRKHFRRFVQVFSGTLRKVYFKEYGDPRLIDNRTGIPVPEGEKIADKHVANEMLHFCQYWAGSSYGVPLHVGVLISLYGSRLAEELNFHYFGNSTIPPGILMISGGTLSDDAFDELDAYWSEETRGVERMHRIVVVDAVPASDNMDKSGNALKIEFKALTDARLKDALFLEYIDTSRKKARSSFRLTPLYTGESEDVTKAVAEASRGVTEEQVFVPERKEFDWVINSTLMRELGAELHVFRSKGPEIGDNDSAIRAMAVFNASGGMNPQISRVLMREILGIDVPDITEAWGEFPIAFTQALAQNGQLRGIERAIGPSTLDDDDDEGATAGNGKAIEVDVEKMARSLLAVREMVQSVIQKQAGDRLRDRGKDGGDP